MTELWLALNHQPGGSTVITTEFFRYYRLCVCEYECACTTPVCSWVYYCIGYVNLCLLYSFNFPKSWHCRNQCAVVFPYFQVQSCMCLGLQYLIYRGVVQSRLTSPALCLSVQPWQHLVERAKATGQGQTDKQLSRWLQKKLMFMVIHASACKTTAW